ncbi:MAG TPA: hypothetical protein VFU74_00770 [Actinocrinis sp.]|nr:hypothetical protein [Actinocrinis sp.]
MQTVRIRDRTPATFNIIHNFDDESMRSLEVGHGSGAQFPMRAGTSCSCSCWSAQQSFEIQAHGGQREAEIRVLLRIIEPDDAQLLGHVPPGPATTQNVGKTRNRDPRPDGIQASSTAL